MWTHNLRINRPMLYKLVCRHCRQLASWRNDAISKNLTTVSPLLTWCSDHEEIFSFSDVRDVNEVWRRTSVSDDDARDDHRIRRLRRRSVDGSDLRQQLVECHENAADLDQDVRSGISASGVRCLAGILKDDVGWFWKKNPKRLF